jgi:secondary thiamine-phosphate synthase enzyme
MPPALKSIFLWFVFTGQTQKINRRTSGRSGVEILNWFKDSIEVRTHGKGLYPFTPLVEANLVKWGVQEGMCFLFLQHTSASLVINESYDPTARIDMEAFLEKLAPENLDWYQHTLEGPDDSSSHLRALVLPVSLTIPVDRGKLSLGTWQGIYLCEHRSEFQNRRVLIRCLGTA